MNNPIILFDGICNLCNSSINFIIKHDKRKQFRFASLQSNFAKEILTKYNCSEIDLNTVVLIQSDKVYLKSSAVIKILQQLNSLSKLAVVFFLIPEFIRDNIYDFMASKRYKYFGKRDICIVHDEEIKTLFLE